LTDNSKEKRPVGKPKQRQKDTNQKDLRVTGCEDENWTELQGQILGFCNDADKLMDSKIRQNFFTG
jgi:hypothetical protein